MVVSGRSDRPWHSWPVSADRPRTILYPQAAQCRSTSTAVPTASTFEILQSIHDDTLTKDPETGVPVERVFHPVAVHFKGKGFHNTDYGTKRRNRELEKSAKDGADKHDAKMADKQAEKKKDKKADAEARREVRRLRPL